MLEEFKKFVAKGNVFDMAVGIIMGAAFKDVVNAFTQGMMIPVRWPCSGTRSIW